MVQYKIPHRDYKPISITYRKLGDVYWEYWGEVESIENVTPEMGSDGRRRNRSDEKSWGRTAINPQRQLTNRQCVPIAAQ